MTYAYVDHARLVADLEAGDGGAVAYAYSQVFAGQMGRLVLTHQLAEAGVGLMRGPGMSALDSRYHDGAGDHALKLLNLAGFGRMSAAHAVAANILEGQTHDGHDANDRNDAGAGFSGPDDAAGFDHLGPG